MPERRRASRPVWRKFRKWTPTLDRLAAKLNLSPQLRDIRLANVLSGNTCTPIGLPDFEAYLAFVEYSLENLHFVVWYQDYRRRFFSLPESEQQYSPGSASTEFPFSTPSHARTEHSIKAAERRATAPSSTTSNDKVSFSSYSSCEALKCTLSRVETHPALAMPERSASAASQSIPLSAVLSKSSQCRAESLCVNTEMQPLRGETSKAVATFLRPGSSKELTLDSRMRDAVIADLTWNTHPDVLLPIYEEIYSSLETVSLPRFLAYASTNINLPRQIFWYVVGLTDFLAGLALAIILITTIPVPPQANRAWRLFAVPLTALGAMQMYSAWRGFCSNIWRRGNMQVRPWELERGGGDGDEERAWFWERMLEEYRRDDAPTGHREKEKADTAVIAPFSLEPPSAPEKRHTTEEEDEGQEEARRDVPVFGPERVVLDPRISAVHARVMRDIYACGFWFSLVYCAIILSVPSPAHD